MNDISILNLVNNFIINFNNKLVKFMGLYTK